MHFSHFAGIDVSKQTLDITLMEADGKTQKHFRIKNTIKEIKATIPKILKEQNATTNGTLFCAEHTGIYTLPLLTWLQQIGAMVWLEAAQRIAATQGLTRGKNDKIDSARIALYSFTYRHKVSLWKAPRPVLTKIKTLLAQRARFIKAKSILAKPLAEQKRFLDQHLSQCSSSLTLPVLRHIDLQIAGTEKQITELIKADERLHHLYKIITSVDGIGFVTAAYLLATTNEFISITEAKKFACYSGVAPFEHASGSSIRGKSKVSHKANKELKTLLHMAALSSVRVKGDLKNYFERKVAEGKNKMSILNAIRNKLVLRVFACIHQNRIFQKDYTYHLAKP